MKSRPRQAMPPTTHMTGELVLTHCEQENFFGMAALCGPHTIGFLIVKAIRRYEYINGSRCIAFWTTL